ncbi:MAG: sigma-70 family RNA polymerase sigma factor [Prevotella sp.]
MRDKAAFEQFFRGNFEKLHLYALHLVNDEEVSRDIVSDAMEYVWNHFSDRDSDQWLKYSVSFVRNRCLDHIRRKAVHKKYADFFQHVVEHKENIGLNEDDERMKDINAAMDTLRPKTRLVLQECYLNRKSYKEVAEELEISTSGVKKHIVIALKTIREEIAKKYKKK